MNILSDITQESEHKKCIVCRVKINIYEILYFDVLGIIVFKSYKYPK